MGKDTIVDTAGWQQNGWKPYPITRRGVVLTYLLTSSSSSSS